MNIIDSVSTALGIEHVELVKFVESAPHRYKKYLIKKRRVNKKTGLPEYRQVAQPSSLVKTFQNHVIDLIRPTIKIHNKALAYQKGTSIKKNALLHKDNQYILKMDLRNFFPSITPEILFSSLERQNIYFDEENLNFIGKLFFWCLRKNSPLRLSIGAPSSPFLSNLVMYDFDCAMSLICEPLSITYSRYADDMTFSTNMNNTLFNIPLVVENELQKIYGKTLLINKEKTVFSSKARNRHVTGIVLTNNNKISLGRNRKRCISSLVHQSSLNMLSAEKVLSLKGYISFVRDIEPEFFDRLVAKYGNECLSKLQS